MAPEFNTQLEELEAIAEKILASGLKSYEAIVRELGLQQYFIPRIFKILSSLRHLVVEYISSLFNNINIYYLYIFLIYFKDFYRKTL